MFTLTAKWIVPWQGLWIRLSVLFLVVGSYLATVIVNIQGERSLIEADIQRISNVATISAEIHTETILEATAQTLRAISSDLLAAPTERSTQSILDDHFFVPPYLLTMLLIDENNTIIASNFRDIVGVNTDAMPFVEAHRDVKVPFIYTGDIIVGNLTGSPHFFSSIGLYQENKRFAGVVAAAYELTYLRNLYAQLVPGDNYAIALFHQQDGLIVASDSEITRGELPKSSQFPSNMTRSEDGSLGQLTILLDGGAQANMVSAQIGDGPFFVVTMANVNGLLAKHHSDSMIKYILAGLFVLTAITLAVALEVYIANRRKAQTEKANLEAELRHAHKMEALGTLAGGLAHEFNNLLSSIIGFGELAKERAENRPKLARSIDHILLAGRRAEGIVNQILTFSRRAETEKKPFPVNQIVQEVMELILVSVPPSIKITVHANDKELWVMGDPGQIHQVVMNLCSNAAQSMPKGGNLFVDISPVEVTEQRQRCLSELTPGNYIKLSIADKGSGIDAAIIGRIFDPFFTTKELGKGTGLGLSIVHGIVKAHNGEITVNSVLGAGTTFDIYLPATNACNDEKERQRLPHIDGAGRKVMFVDDDDGIVRLLEERLLGMNFVPIGFLDPIKALEAFHAAPGDFDLVITDFSMPSMTGLDLTEALHTQRPDLPIILMTGYGVPNLAEQAADKNIFKVMKKPLRMRKITEAIVSVLNIDEIP